MKIYMYRSDVSFPAGAGRWLSVDGRELEEAENGQQFVSLEDHRKAVEEAVAKEREECADFLGKLAEEWEGPHSYYNVLSSAALDVQNGSYHATRQEACPQVTSPEDRPE